MASLLTCAATSVGWCFCTATASLLGSCCGNDKASTIPPSATSGRRRSVLLMFMSIALSLIFQYPVASAVVENDYASFFIQRGFVEGCLQYEDEDDDALFKSCVGVGLVFRVGFATGTFFLLAAVAVLFKPTANREAWPAKYAMWIFLCGISLFIPNEPFFSDVYLNLARIGAIVFVGIQQLVILDIAYDWNESWVAKANAADAEEADSGKKWLGAILASCVILFTISIASLILIAIHFTGCGTNNAFIAITAILGVLITVAQLGGDEGSLLSSACVFTWAVFLCYTAVTKNPDEQCNPKLGEPDNVSIVLGITVTLISLCWTGWSFTAEDKLTSKPEAADSPLIDGKEKEEAKVTGIVTGNYGTDDDKEGEGSDGSGVPVDADSAAMNDPKRLSNSWKLNIILVVVSCWQAMALTNFGSISADGNAANPQVGKVGMWVIISSQWLALSLYFWTLVAPKILQGRDFG